MKVSFKIIGERAAFGTLLALTVVALNSRAQTNNSAPDRPEHVVLVNGRTVEVIVVETAEEKEQKEIEAKALALLKARDYDALEKFAGDLRRSKTAWGNGTWKLANVYFGLEPRGDKPDWDARMDALQSWVTARPESITARVALAYVEVDYAWNARGSGWADTVTDEGWRLFGLRLNEAVRVLDNAKKLQAKCPVYWTVRMRAALGLSMEKEKFDALSADALRAWPDYEPIYLRRAIYLLPRWMGNPGEWEKDLANSADKVGGQGGDILYAQVVWCIHQSTSMKNIFKENELSWPRVDRGFQDLEKRFPESLGARSEHAHLAVLAKDREAARNCFDAMNGKVDMPMWESKFQYISFLVWSHFEEKSSNRRAVAKPIPPAASQPPAIVKPESYAGLHLKGISGAPGRRLVIINNKTFMLGETEKVHVGDRSVEVTCTGILEDSVLIIVDGKPVELKLGAKSSAPKTDKVAQK